MTTGFYSITTCYVDVDKLPESLRMMRKKRGLTLKRVSEISELSISFISDMECGRTAPSMATLKKLSKAYESVIILMIGLPNTTGGIT